MTRTTDPDPEAHKDAIRRLFEDVLNGGRLGFLDTLIGSDYVDHSPASGQAAGRDGVKARIQTLREAFPDIRYTLDDCIAEGAIVAVRYHWEGAHRGPFLGIPPTGKRIAVRGMDFYRLDNGRIVEHWDNVDEFGMLSQLGELG